MKEVDDHEKGRKLLSVVERIIDDTENVIALVERHHQLAVTEQPGIDQDDLMEMVAERLVKHYSTATAISGGVSALPALFPGAGSVLALTGGTLLDVGMMLKYEVEMALALCWNFGFDVRQDRERKLAFLLASVTTHDEQTGDSFLADVAAAEGMAIWNYAPRQLPKVLVQVLARIALQSATKSVARALPLVGIAVGAGINKSLTKRVGQRCVEELKKRRAAGEHEIEDAEVVQAQAPADAEAPGDDAPAPEEDEDDVIDSIVVSDDSPVEAPADDGEPAAPPAEDEQGEE